MKFNKVIVTLAILTLAVQAYAQQDGALRRTVVADNEVVNVDIDEAPKTSDVIILNSSTAVAPVQQAPAPQPMQMPSTVVEAQPVSESRAEQLRKARQSAELATEQKIVEKLEAARLKEEQDRADRLFGNKLDAQTATPPAAAETVVVPEQKPAPAQVTIEKVEIIQPAASELPPPMITSVKELKEVDPVTDSSAPSTSSTSMKMEDLEEEKTVKETQLYVSGSIGGLNYDASNVKSNFGGGFAVGTIIKERVGVEASFLYSNHFIDTFWNPGIYRELDQYDIGVNAKYYILNTRIKPYVGAGVSYIIRNYKQRIVTSNIFGTSVANGPSEDQTDSINLGLAAGADFEVNDVFRIGAGLDWSTNLMNRNEFDFYNYYATLPENTKALEEIDFWTVKVTGTVTF